MGDRVFTANESPPDKRIPFHHELAQSPTFPHRVLFYCDLPAKRGGATPVLNSNRVYRRIAADFPDFMDELESKGVRCVHTCAQCICPCLPLHLCVYYTHKKSSLLFRAICSMANHCSQAIYICIRVSDAYTTHARACGHALR